MLNLPRLDARHVNHHLKALQFAKGGQLPFELFDDIAMSEEEAEEMQLDANIARALADLKAGR